MREGNGLMVKRKNSVARIFVWILLGLLFLGLAGFGATNLSGTVRSVGEVGGKPLDIDRYARMLSQEIRAVESETGQNLTFAEVSERGLDQRVLRRFFNSRALDAETERLGLSIGDENLRDQLVDIPAFQGLDGSFDREAYRFALEQAGISETEFETQLREENARTLLQGAILSGTEMPAAYAETLVGFLGETRDFTWTRLDRANLVEPLGEASDAVLRAYYDENIDDYMLPETKRITYAVLTPDMLIDEIEVDEELLRQEYEARRAEYVQPERRLVERLVFADEESANRAAAQLEVAGATFNGLVEERGLSLQDIDMGDVSRLELDAAGEAVFSAEPGDVVGPLPSDLGPALFRVNGVLPAQTVTFEEAEPELRVALASDRARRLVDQQVQNLDDLLAGGATLEELANETDMELGTIDWFWESGEGIAAYNGFRDAARILEKDDFPQIEELEDGGIFAMRLDEVLPPRPASFEDARLNVLGNWEAEQIEARLAEQAEGLIEQLRGGSDFADLDLEAVAEEALDRNGFVAGTPPEFMSEVFTMAPGEVRAIDSFGALLIVRLDRIIPASENAEAQAILAQLRQQASDALGRELFGVYNADVTIKAEPRIDQRALDAVHANFP